MKILYAIRNAKFLALRTYVHYDAVSQINNAITNAGSSFESVIAAAAAVISTVISSVSGIVLLVLCIMTMVKSGRGNEEAWSDAMGKIATVAAILCFSTSIMAIFF